MAKDSLNLAIEELSYHPQFSLAAHDEQLLFPLHRNG